ncbi:MAG: nodulation protein NfeD [Thiocapsa sp.]|nr:nodulation protein NfeD [Thiocapsa sp.]MCG6984061.1 nodulation protein NfeD [Thiocapsa sp.]
MPKRIRRWMPALVMGLMMVIPAGLLAREALLIGVEGAIGPASAAFVEDAVSAAEEQGAGLLILRLDTPGGLDTSMRSIVKAITASRVAVIGYVAPTGARAASAGTYILYACSVAAMAPGTNLGAATPVQLGGLPSPAPKPTTPASPDDTSDAEPAATPGESPDRTQPAEREPPAEASGDAGSRKAIHDAAAYIRSLAELHGRNADWAERSVREGESLSAEEALELGVVDLIAPDLDALLEALDGRSVRVGEARVVLETAGMQVVAREPSWKTRLLAIISDPNLAYILLLVGIYGLVYEFSNPGAVLPGTVGAVSLLLALYAFQLLPINYAGAGLILLGLALMIAEAFVPSFGALGLGGAATFVMGSLILIDTEVPGFGISLPLILGFALSSALLLFFVIGMALKAYRRPVTSGAEELVGAIGEAVSGFPGAGSVHLHGETWSARSERGIAPGARVRVVGRDGLTLLVEPVSDA